MDIPPAEVIITLTGDVITLKDQCRLRFLMKVSYIRIYFVLKDYMKRKWFLFGHINSSLIDCVLCKHDEFL